MQLKKSPALVRQKIDFSKKFFSQEEDSDFAILMRDIKKLDEPRPLGLSGHLRAKNEALSVGLAIETCIDGLDELIITVQPSDDDTYEICKQKAEKYPDKIKLFYYTPEVVAVPFSHCFHKDTQSQNGNNFSIHNFAHYSNYGLVKLTYKYYVKIDADQIYFTSKLKELRDAILMADKYAKPKRNILNKILGRLHRPFYNILSSVLSIKTFVKWMTLINGRCAYGLCGINLTRNSAGGGAISLGDIDGYFLPLQPVYSSVGTFGIYNGGMDTFIFSPNSSTLHEYFIDHSVEMLCAGDAAAVRNLGCFWLHFGMVKKNVGVVGEYGQDYLSLKDYLNSNSKDLFSKIKFPVIYKPDYEHFTTNLNWHFDKDKQYIQELLNQK